MRRSLRLVLALVVAIAGTLMVGVTPAAAMYRHLCTGYAGCDAAGYGNAGYASNGTSYWGMYPGHNCTNYAAYRLIKNGVDASYLRGQGNAYQWGGVARAHGVAVDGTPRVGDIAWWDKSKPGFSSNGHVGYVEQVGNGYFTISDDNFGGDFHWTRVDAANWPSGFIHFQPTGTRQTPDVIARRSDGQLFLYPGSGTGGWKSGGVQIGSGWDQFTAITGAGDFNGDGTQDVIARRSDGQLFLYPGSGTGGWKSGGVQIGSGWDQFTAITGAGDFNGDGTQDVIARRSDGQLFLYPGSGTGGWKSGGVQIGSGWDQFTAITGAGDFNGDGTQDVIARRSDGQLFLYPGSGTGGWKSGGVQIGSGWDQFTAITGAGDFNGDGTQDVIARRSDGQLFLYPGSGTGGWKSGGVQIGSGWDQFTAITGAGDFNAG